MCWQDLFGAFRRPGILMYSKVSVYESKQFLWMYAYIISCMYVVCITIYVYIYIFAQFKNNHIHEPYHAKALGCRWLQSLLWLPLVPWMVNAQSSVFFGSSTLHYSVNFLEATNFRITFDLSYVSSLRLKQHQENQERAGYHKGWPLWTLPHQGSCALHAGSLLNLRSGRSKFSPPWAHWNECFLRGFSDLDTKTPRHFGLYIFFGHLI